MESNVLVPVISLIVGWLLSEGSHSFRQRDVKRMALRRLVSELIEIRHRILAVQFLLSELKKNFNFDAKTLYQIRQGIPTYLQIDNEMSDRFNVSVTDLAAHDPFLAFYLRGKNLFGLVSASLFSQADIENGDASMVNNLDSSLQQTMLSELESLVLKVSLALGPVSFVRAFLHIWQSRTTPMAVRRTMDQIVDSIRNAMIEESSGTSHSYAGVISPTADKP